MIKRISKIYLMLQMLIIFCSASVGASSPEVVYNNLGAGDSYSMSFSRVVGTYSTYNYTVATPFTPVVSGYISDIWVAVGHGGEDAGANAIEIVLMSDDGGNPSVPNSVIASWDVRDQMVSYGTENSPLHIVADGTTQFSAGTKYWIAARIPADVSWSYNEWHTNNLVWYGDVAYKDLNSGEGWKLSNTALNAFRLSAYIIDNCPADPDKTEPGVCGCGTADTDSDGDGTPDCNDQCPSDPDKTAPGTCGCGTADVDSDSDGKLNCEDNCPDVSNPDQTDGNRNGIGDVCESLPDLTVNWTTLKFSTKNNTCSGRVTIGNIGTLNATTFSVAYYLSDNGSDPGTQIGTDTISGLRAGRSVSGSFRYKSTTSLLGKYVIAIVDTVGQVFEKDENNNRASRLIE